jgi:hypothetical protein
LIIRLAVRNNCSSFELKGGELLERGALFFYKCLCGAEERRAVR